MPFDPTPAESRAAAFAALSGGEERGIGAVVGELYYDFERWVATGDEGYMEDFAAAALELPTALWTSVTRSPLAAVLIALALLSILGWRFLRRKRPATKQVPRRRPSAETDLYGHPAAGTRAPRSREVVRADAARVRARRGRQRDRGVRERRALDRTVLSRALRGRGLRGGRARSPEAVCRRALASGERQASDSMR